MAEPIMLIPTMSELGWVLRANYSRWFICPVSVVRDGVALLRSSSLLQRFYGLMNKLEQFIRRYPCYVASKHFYFHRQLSRRDYCLSQLFAANTPSAPLG